MKTCTQKYDRRIREEWFIARPFEEVGGGGGDRGQSMMH